MQSPPKTAVFESDLAPLLSAFVAEKQRFGFKYNSTEAYLKSFDKVPLVLQLKSVKQGKHLPGDFKGMVFVVTIENKGKVPTFEVLKKIVRELAIDGSLIFYPEKPVKDSEVEDLVRMLYSCDDRSLKIIRATVKAALESQTENE